MVRTWTVCCVLACVAAGATAQDFKVKNGWYENSKYGFKIRPPEKYDLIPIAVDEKWVVTKYLSQKEYLARGEFPIGAKVTMRVIVFLDEMRKQKGVKVEENQSGDGLLLDTSVPYKDYPDFLKRTLGEGHFIDKDADTKGAGGIPARHIEVKIEKLAAAKRRILTWVFRGEDADYAVEFDAFEDHFEKLAPVFKECLKSFQFVKRAATLTAGGTTPGEKIDLSDAKGRNRWKELSAEERKQRRKQDEEVRFRKAKTTVPEGWLVKESKNFFVISHADEKFTQRVVDHAEAVRKWMEENFADLSDEYVTRLVIRVFADYDEYRAYARDISGFSTTRREILTYKDASMGRRSGFENLYRYVGEAYISDKDSGLFFSTPPWFDNGFYGVLGAASVKDGKLAIEPDIWEAQLVAEGLRAGKPPAARALMEMSNEDFYKDQKGFNTAYATRLVRWMVGAGKKDKQAKTLLTDYLKATRAVIDDEDASGVGAGVGSGQAQTEEEEERQVKERREAAKKRSGEQVKKINERAFAQWTDAQWAALQKGYEGALK